LRRLLAGWFPGPMGFTAVMMSVWCLLKKKKKDSFTMSLGALGEVEAAEALGEVEAAEALGEVEAAEHWVR